MALPKVTITIEGGNLGRIDDIGNGVPGLIVLMASSPTGHAFGDVVAYSNFDDLPAELQAIDGLDLYFKVAPGYKVYIMPVASTTLIADIVDQNATTPYAKNLVVAGNGEIRFIGIIGTLLKANVATCITNAQALAVYFAGLHNPVFVILPYSFRTADTITDLTLGTSNRVGVVLSYQGDEVGLLLGRLASTQVHIHPGKVADGAMPISEALLDGAAGTPTKVEDDMTKVASLHDAGYIVLGVYTRKAGYYFMGMPLATATTDDYATIVNRRTIDKGQIIAYDTFVTELNREVYVTADGKLQPGYVKGLQAKIEDAIDKQMTSQDEISGRKSFINDNQDVIATSKIEGTVKIQPVGHSSFIEIKLGLTKTL